MRQLVFLLSNAATPAFPEEAPPIYPPQELARFVNGATFSHQVIMMTSFLLSRKFLTIKEYKVFNFNTRVKFC